VTVVLASHLPGEGHFRSTKHTVVPIPCVGDRDYSDAMRRWWGTSHDLVNVEHDHDPTDEQIQELLDCPHDLCTFAYLLHHLPEPAHYAQRDGGTGYGEWIKAGVEWCGFSGIGFCKITRGVRVRPLEASSWQEVDCRVSDATDADWHVHWKSGPDGPVGVDHFHYA
jgi:hypothetical protein